MTKQFEKQVALVTGGSTGIGAAAAKQLAELGAKVLITGRHEATLKLSAAAHPNIEWLVGDISQDATEAVNQVRKRHGRLDILVNNAGILELASLADATAEHVARTFDVNVRALIETTRAALPLLKESKGTIVNISSVVADQPFANMSVYCASKAAVVALTRSWAQELAADGIRVNVVSPGPIETPMFTAQKLKISNDALGEMGSHILSLVPAKRFGKPEEVAQVIIFLASSNASYVNGAQYTVGGGIEA